MRFNPVARVHCMSIDHASRSRSHIPQAEGFNWRMCPDKLFMHKDLEPIDIKVWLVLMVYARDRGECNPTNKSLADMVGCSVRTIKYSLVRLEDAGFLIGKSRGPHRTITLRPEGWDSTPQPFTLKTFVQV